MIEVRVRHYDEAEAVHLMDWDPADLDAVIPFIQRWGLRFESEGISHGTEASLVGEIVVDADAAFFEVVYLDD